MSNATNEQLILRNDVLIYFISVIFKEPVRKPVNLNQFDCYDENTDINGLNFQKLCLQKVILKFI